MDKWYKDVEYMMNEQDIDVIIPNCGQCSRVLQGRIYQSGWRGLSLDMGSLFDVWALPIPRTWIRLEGHRVRWAFR